MRPFIPKKEHNDHEIITSKGRILTEENNGEDTNKNKRCFQKKNSGVVQINNITYIPKNNKYKVCLSEQEIKDFLVDFFFNKKNTYFLV